MGNKFGTINWNEVFWKFGHFLKLGKCPSTRQTIVKLEATRLCDGHTPLQTSQDKEPSHTLFLSLASC